MPVIARFNRNFPGRGAPVDLARRRFVQGVSLAGLALGLPLPLSAGAGGGQRVLEGTEFDLTIGEAPVNFTGRSRTALTVNGQLPAPLLRWREGDTVTLRVCNRLAVPSSIHWHGILLPANMDGVPGLSFAGIPPGGSYVYRFLVRQAGTYWYHSHSAFQEQSGLYGPLVITPRTPEPIGYDRDYVVLLSDWTDIEAEALFARLKKVSDYDNYYQRTVGDFVRDAREDGLAAALADRRMWGQMRMTPTDLSDVNAHTYTYLMNGVPPAGNWTGLFRPGERLRLRLVNASAMSYFDVRIPGLKMTVVAADGQNVHPVTVDELRIADAETFDVIVTPTGAEAFTIFAQDMGRTGFACGTLAVRPGLRAPLPAPDPRPLLTMADMGHGGGHAGHAAGGQGGHDDPGGHDGQGDHDSQGGHATHAGHGAHAGPPASPAVLHPASEAGNPLVDMQAVAPAPRLNDPGVGLRDNGRKVLTYADLHSLFPDPDGRDPGREIELHLTGHMERFAWSFDGVKFSDAEPLRLRYGERLRITLVNDTMMSHPIHLHGMWSDLEDEQGEFLVRKHTIDMPPGTKRSYRVRADALGRWAYHCHLLYHMEAGMFREVRVEE